MKKKLIQLGSILMLLGYQQASAQLYSKGDIIGNRHFQDCDGNIYSTFDYLADGKPLIIFCSTVDCGYCFEEAPEVGKAIIANKEKINFVFALTQHNNFPQCSSKDAGDHDWPGDWVQRYPGYNFAVSTIQPGADPYWNIDCGVTTSFGAIHPSSKKIIGGGCREGGQSSALNASLALYTDGTIKRFANSIAKLQMNISNESGGKKVAISTSTAGSEIYYTIDGSVPSKNALKYTSPFLVKSTCLVKAIAYKSDMNNSGVLIKFVEYSNPAYKNIAGSGIGYEWVGLADANSNANRKSLAAVNDGKFDDVSLNGGNSEASKDVYEAFGVIWDKVRNDITAIKLTNNSPKTNNYNTDTRSFQLNMKIQTTMDGTTWQDLEIGYFPEYPYGFNQALQQNQGPMNIFTDKPFSAKGIRIAGQVNINSNVGNGMSKFAGLKELEIFTGDVPTAIDEINLENGISIFPNPSSGVINIRFADLSFTEYTLTDLAGRSVLTNKIKGSSEVIDISQLEKGMYLFSAKGSKSYVQKIVVE